MKTLIFGLLLTSQLFSNSMECQTALNMYQSNIELSKPITDAQLITVIDACHDETEHIGIVNIMKLMLETTIEV